MILENISPKDVFSFFEKLTTIPRGSGNEKEVSDYLVCFAKERGLEVIQDDFNNVIIKKPATKGYEHLPTVIIQGHMDMVCEKNSDTEFDFARDPLKIKIEDDYITAEGTTLGADNGIAIAYALAILNSKELEHPSLEVVITTDEETGMSGAANLDKNLLSGKYLINIDSESEGTFIVGCAGGAKATLKLPITTETKKGELVNIALRGLKGGHSGEDINKNRGNANKLMGRLLYQISKEVNYNIVNINGGAKDNAIPREMDVEILIDGSIDKITDIVTEINNIYKREFAVSDPEINLSVKFDGQKELNCFDEVTTNKIVSIINTIPNGIQTMSADIEGLVESSLNLGVVVTKDDYLELILALRSSVKTRLDYIIDQLKIIAKLYEAEFILRSEYPAWEFKRDSKLREIFASTYRQMYNKEPGIKAIHAGLECGIFSKGIEGVDIISIGPDMEDIHTPDERLNIPSAARVYDFVVQVLKNMKS